MPPRQSSISLVRDDASTAEPRAAITVLVVEDDFDAREILQSVLEHEGYAVVTASNGVEGIGRLHMEPRPSLVLCDLMMPVMDGWEFCATKQSDPAIAAIPVIIVSAVARTRGMPPLPGQAALAKPVQLDQLLELVAAYCGAPSSPERRARQA